MPIYLSLTFWTLVAGLLAFIVKYFYPQFPLDEAGILSLVLFFLGLFGITPTAKGVMVANPLDIFKSMQFWTMVAGLLWFVAQFFLPDFPLDSTKVLEFIVFLLALFGVKPELKVRGLLR